MKTIIKIPLLLVAMLILLMYAIDMLKLGYVVVLPAHVFLAVAIFILGLLILVVGGYAFRKAKTTVNPTTPEKATRLVTTGIYQYSRNPMYLGYLLWLIACVIYSGNVANLLLLPLYLFLANILYILPEEKALEILFKEEYRGYKNSVRRWL